MKFRISFTDLTSEIEPVDMNEEKATAELLALGEEKTMSFLRQWLREDGFQVVVEFDTDENTAQVVKR